MKAARPAWWYDTPRDGPAWSVTVKDDDDELLALLDQLAEKRLVYECDCGAEGEITFHSLGGISYADIEAALFAVAA
ncbi:MAG: hypothetical protein ACRDNE_16900 [Gaiellaceae bacterium]